MIPLLKQVANDFLRRKETTSMLIMQTSARRQEIGNVEETMKQMTMLEEKSKQDSDKWPLVMPTFLGGNKKQRSCSRKLKLRKRENLKLKMQLWAHYNHSWRKKRKKQSNTSTTPPYSKQRLKK